MTTTYNNLSEACQAIMNECPNEYAKSYARAFLTGETAHGYGVDLQDANRTQALYILSNITHWRGPTAKAVRTYLKQMVAAADFAH